MQFYIRQICFIKTSQNINSILIWHTTSQNLSHLVRWFTFTWYNRLTERCSWDSDRNHRFCVSHHYECSFMSFSYIKCREATSWRQSLHVSECKSLKWIAMMRLAGLSVFLLLLLRATHFFYWRNTNTVTTGRPPFSPSNKRISPSLFSFHFHFLCFTSPARTSLYI